MHEMLVDIYLSFYVFILFVVQDDDVEVDEFPVDPDVCCLLLFVY